VAVFSQDGEATTQPGREMTPAFTGSAKTIPSEATFRNISQNMNRAVVVRSVCATSGRTRLYSSMRQTYRVTADRTIGSGTLAPAGRAAPALE
jgi:hypothetical protein